MSTPFGEIHAFSIDWHCFRPLVPTLVERVILQAAVDTAAMQVQYALCPQRWIKSPFQSRASVQRVDEALDLKQVVGSYVVHTQMALNITCHLGGHLLDPDTMVKDIPIDQVLCFKVAPLLGGAKKAEQLKTCVKNVMASHGVASDACVDRANAFFEQGRP